ncbi:hypothetical protein HGRIS_012055 [Hohenbuehelia grisea]|uniref:Uncharacterized protein n=1 Tax=Hohenbuehelia grisea TaxID=104357 RepID=A0ABR3IR38_9AGAR
MAEREHVCMDPRGGILADEQGLGQNLAVLRLIADGIAKTDACKPTLIVCPCTQINSWDPASYPIFRDSKMSLVIYHGPLRQKDHKLLSGVDIVITTYAILGSEYKSHLSLKKDASKERLTHPLFHLQFGRLVLDDAHLIKNHKSDRAMAACAIQADSRLAVTSTPMENTLVDLASLMKFIRHKNFYPPPVFSRIAVDLSRKSPPAMAVKSLMTATSHCLLRRTKSDVANEDSSLALPSLDIRVVKCSFNALEQEVYDTFFFMVREKLEMLLGDRADSVASNALAWLNVLRQVCDHPRLILSSDEDLETVEPNVPEEVDDKDSDTNSLTGAFARIRLRKKWPICKTGVVGRYHDKDKDYCEPCGEIKTRVSKSGAFGSAKVREIMKSLPSHDGKTIIVSCYPQMLDVIQASLSDAGIQFARYDGSMSDAERSSSERAIQSDPNVQCLLLSLKAVHKGLNFSSCVKVIFVDPWWNPFAEERVLSLVHCAGQERPVKVIKLIAKDSIEESILKIQKKKIGRSQAILNGTAQGCHLRDSDLSDDEILAIFGVGGSEEDRKG